MGTNTGKAAQTANGSVDQYELSRDVILEILSNQRRRFALHYLKQQDIHYDRDDVPIGELADQVASWENDKPIDELTTQERKRVQNALRQFHLPKMTDCGFVAYDPQQGKIRLTEVAAKSDFYIDVLPKRGIPWGMYYLGFTGLSTICLIGILTGIYPFTFFSPTMWSVFFVTAFGVSAFGHFYDNHYRMRIGARDKPPEVEER